MASSADQPKTRSAAAFHRQIVPSVSATTTASARSATSVASTWSSSGGVRFIVVGSPMGEVPSLAREVDGVDGRAARVPASSPEPSGARPPGREVRSAPGASPIARVDGEPPSGAGAPPARCPRDGGLTVAGYVRVVTLGMDDHVIGDEELAALALAADPDVVVDEDAVPFGGPGPGVEGVASLLPAWY